MKNRPNRLALVAGLLVLLNPQIPTAFAQGTAFTYQGRLNLGANPANGNYDFRFTLWNVESGGFLVSGTTGVNALPVSNGLFTVSIDFGPEIFTGADRWLEIVVRTNGGGLFDTLSPRQKLTSTPYAVRALEAGGLPAGAVSAAMLADGAVSSNKLGVESITSDKILDGTITGADVNAAGFNTTFWRATGNAATTPGTHFLGTTDNQPLELRANNQRALRIEPNTNGAPNILAGFAENHMAPGVIGATIAGGGGNGFFGDSYTNRVLGIFGTVIGGANNTASGPFSTAGGANSTASGHSSVALGGFAFAEGPSSFALGSCTASGWYARALGTSCEASGQAATAMGNNARAAHRSAFVWADSQNPTFASTADDQFLIRARGGVGINTTTPGAMLQVGDEGLPGSQGMIRLASRSGNGPQTRHWDIGVPQGNSDVSGKFYSFTIDDPRLGTEPEVVVRWDTGNVGIGTTAPISRLHAVASAGNGVQGSSSDAGASGVYGENLSGGGYGVAGRATGTGNGVFGENPNASGWAGNFVGNVRVTGTINPPSDRNVKRDFEGVNAREVLEKVAALSIQTWAYTNDTRGTRHLGPVAQEFKAAFGLGADDKSIATVDADGVALAAIQGLNQKLEAEVKSKDARIAELERRLSAIESLLQK